MKLDELWQKIEASAYTALPGIDFGGWQTILNVLTTPASLLTLDKTFTHKGDELPVVHRKWVHPFGTVAKVAFRSAGGHPYTGIFAEAEALGLARLSLAGAPALIGFTPGLALKFPIARAPSVNVLAMHALTSQGADHNIFTNPFSNTLPKTPFSLTSPATWAIAALNAVFGSVSADPRHLPVDELAAKSTHGMLAEHPVAPHTLTLTPTRAAHDAVAAAPGDFRVALAGLAPGTVLYDVSGDGTALGTLTLESAFVASSFGDEQLFFRHTRRA
jgi:hypothetical protein